MFIAHIPSGYILSTSIVERIRNLPVKATIAIPVGILGALAPDFDMLYFYLIDHQQTHHHKYITHWPLLWLSLIIISSSWFRFSSQSKAASTILIFSLGGLLHLILDTLVGDIWWLSPFINEPYALFTVPALVKPWWLNFIIHWSFAVEVAIFFWAVARYRSRSNKKIEG
ncbi:MAG: metal-dependent hydrolase [Immundisolibacteraceae bacterium]|nr:metal-dependent hydrolase [Immundisolibacteraceae bacterium]